jgi:hypothetical protein
MQQQDDKLQDVIELPVHLFVKSQKEAKKIGRSKWTERASTITDITQGMWYKLMTWYKK